MCVVYSIAVVKLCTLLINDLSEANTTPSNHSD